MNVETDSEFVSSLPKALVKEFSLQEHLNKFQLEEIYKLFESSPRKDFKKSLFQSKILKQFKIDISNEELELLLSKLDFNRNEVITWDEFITYLILELECKEKEAYQSVIGAPIIDSPQFICSGHRSGVIYISYSPSVRLNGTIDHDDGKYLTMSKDGQLNVWSCDLKLLRTYRDSTVYATFKSTMVTNFVCLPDLNMIVTSSTELELRFYDMTSKKFQRVLAFENLPYCINHMYYHFTENVKDESLLICGDLGGNLRIFQFPKEDKGPFRMKIGKDSVVLQWEDILKGKLPLMKAYSITNVHLDWVKQVAYYKLLGSIVSCSSSNLALVVTDIHGSKNRHPFYLKRGIDTFCPCEDVPMIATGGADRIIRLWNPFITAKPISFMRGHHASIVKIFFQNKGQRMFSLDRARVIRVWGIISQTCLQIYTGFTPDPGPMSEVTACYNEENHLLVVGGIKIGSVTCGKLVDELRSDGHTLTGEVTVVLYNKVFKLVVTCGTGSNIVIWDIRTNKLKGSIRKAHSYTNMGVLVPLPITAATFDVQHSFLLTGSTNGSIKMWDFNFGICLRNMDIGRNLEVTRLIWMKNRIFAVGWNRRVVEYSDVLTGNIYKGKQWELRHTNDILAADFISEFRLMTLLEGYPPLKLYNSYPKPRLARVQMNPRDFNIENVGDPVTCPDEKFNLLSQSSNSMCENDQNDHFFKLVDCVIGSVVKNRTYQPEPDFPTGPRLQTLFLYVNQMCLAKVEYTGRPGNCLATGAYNGDVILWRLETGQSYKKYNATYPTSLVKLEFKKDRAERKTEGLHTSKYRQEKKEMLQAANDLSLKNAFSKQLKVPARNLFAQKVQNSAERNLAVVSLIFLKKREMLPDQATLLTATENGMIQAWSHHPGGSFLEAFKAVHTQTDYVMTMATDDDNEFLFTGTFCGYIKIWLMKNYCLSASVPPVHICMPQYRLQFPFLIRDSIITRAKAACKNQPKPLLLSSYKGHLGPINSLTYILESKILLTGSFDKSARAWTLSGRYIGTLGQKKPWLHIEWGEDPEKTNSSADFRVPPDLVRTASYTTLKVLRGAPPLSVNSSTEKVDLNISEEEMKLGTYGKRLTSPYMGHHHSFPQKIRGKHRVTPIGVKIVKFPVFVNLRLSQWKPVSRPRTPEYVDEIKTKANFRKSTSKLSLSMKKSRLNTGEFVGKNIILTFF